MRPDGAKRSVEQERTELAALEIGNEPEMGQLDVRLADAVEFAQAGRLAIHAQDMDMRRWKREQALELT